MSWKSRFDLVLMNVQEREDQGNVVDELTCIQKDGLLLKIRGMGALWLPGSRMQIIVCLFYLCHGYKYYILASFDVVDELPHVEVELNKAQCRVKAFKVT